MNFLKLVRSPQVSIVMAFLVLFTSCTQFEQYGVEENLVGKAPRTERILTNSQIEEIGRLHNHYLEMAINAVDANSPTLEEDIEETMLGFDIKEISQKQKEFLYEKNSAIDTKAIIAKYGTNVSEYFNKMTVAINSAENHAELAEGFDQIKKEALQNLIGEEQERVLVLLSVGVNSAEFWMPVSIGGNGIGDKFLNRNKKEAPGWAVVMLNDMAGALEGVSGWVLGILIAGGPVSLGGYLVTVGFGAAVASIKAAL